MPWTRKSGRFIYPKDLSNIDYQGGENGPTENDLRQVESRLQMLASGRPIGMNRFHSSKSDLFEVKVNRRKRLIFQLINIAGERAFFLKLLEVDHKHDRTLNHHENSSKSNIPSFERLDKEAIEDKGCFLIDQARLYLGEAAAEEKKSNSVYYNNGYVLPDEVQMGLMHSDFRKGVYLHTAPAGAGKTLCAAGLVQRFYEEITAAYIEDVSKPRRIMFIAQSAGLVGRERENFQSWDSDYQSNPSVNIEFIPYDFFVYRVVTEKYSEQYLERREGSERCAVNKAFLAWKEKLVRKSEVLIDIVDVKKIQARGLDNALSAVDVEDIYRELVLNSAILNKLKDSPSKWGAYLDLGDRQSLIPKENEQARKAIVALYFKIKGKYQDRYHLPFLPVEVSDEQKADDVIFDEAQDLSSAQVDNMRAAASERCVFFGDNHQTLDGRSVLQYIRQSAENRVVENDGKLHVNYRTPSTIIYFLNSLLLLKHKLVGLQDKDDYKEVKAPGFDDEILSVGHIELCDPPNDSEAKARESVTGTSADFAVITFDEEKISELQRKYNTYMVFTPSGIKGFEFKRVVVHGAFDHDSARKVNDLLGLKHSLDLGGTGSVGRKQRGDSIRHEQEIVSWINTLYVCISRATESVAVEGPAIDKRHACRHLIDIFNQSIEGAKEKSQQLRIDRSGNGAAFAIAAEAAESQGATPAANLVKPDVSDISEETFQKSFALVSRLIQESDDVDALKVKGLLQRFYPQMDDHSVLFIQRRVSQEDGWQPDLNGFLCCLHQERVSRLLENEESRPINYAALWKEADIMLGRSVHTIFTSCFKPDLDDSQFENCIKITAELFKDYEVVKLFSMTGSLSRAENRRLKEAVAACCHKYQCAHVLKEAKPKERGEEPKESRSESIARSHVNSLPSILSQLSGALTIRQVLSGDFKLGEAQEISIIKESLRFNPVRTLHSLISDGQVDIPLQKKFAHLLSKDNELIATFASMLKDVFYDPTRLSHTMRNGLKTEKMIHQMLYNMSHLFELVLLEPEVYRPICIAVLDLVFDTCRYNVSVIENTIRRFPDVFTLLLNLTSPKSVDLDEMIVKARLQFAKMVSFKELGGQTMLHIMAQCSINILIYFLGVSTDVKAMRDRVFGQLNEPDAQGRTVIWYIIYNSPQCLDLLLLMLPKNPDYSEQVLPYARTRVSFLLGYIADDESCSSSLVDVLSLRFDVTSLLVHVIANSDPQTMIFIFGQVYQGKLSLENVMSLFAKKDTQGWTVFHILAKYAPENLLLFLELLNFQQDEVAIEQFMQQLCVKTQEDWSLLHFMAADAPKSLERLFEMIVHNKLYINTLMSFLKLKNSDDWTVLRLMASYSAKSVIALLKLVRSDDVCLSQFFEVVDQDALREIMGSSEGVAQILFWIAFRHLSYLERLINFFDNDCLMDMFFLHLMAHYISKNVEHIAQYEGRLHGIISFLGNKFNGCIMPWHLMACNELSGLLQLLKIGLRNSNHTQHFSELLKTTDAYGWNAFHIVSTYSQKNELDNFLRFIMNSPYRSVFINSLDDQVMEYGGHKVSYSFTRVRSVEDFLRMRGIVRPTNVDREVFYARYVCQSPQNKMPLQQRKVNEEERRVEVLQNKLRQKHFKLFKPARSDAVVASGQKYLAMRKAL